MLHFIINQKQKTSKYLGLLGVHLIEILDNDPYLIKVLKDNRLKKIYTPSNSSRFRGDRERMVLMGLNTNALFALRKSNEPQHNQRVELIILV